MTNKRKGSMRARTIRRAVDIALPIVGIVLVLGAVLFLWRSLHLQLAIVIIGIFFIEAGIWKLAHPLLPSQRKYGALRAEVDGFIRLVRRLNSAALARDTDTANESALRVEDVRQEMLDSVERMVDLAGKESEVAPPRRSRQVVS